MTNDVVTLGECLVSFVAATPGPMAEAGSFERHIAGAEANVAVGLARLGHGSAYIGRVGDDGFGTAIIRRLRGEGVDVTWLARDPDAPTGLMFRERRALGPAQVLYARIGSAASRVSPDDVDRAAADGCFDDARWLHVTGITPALSATARAATDRAIELGRAAGVTVSFDVNLRRRLWPDEAAAPVVRSIAERADVVLGSPDELAVLTGTPVRDGDEALARATLALGPRFAVVKLGEAGAHGQGRDPAMAVHVPALYVSQVLDPVGAGDAFCAGFIAARLDGADLEGALRQGNACGAAAVASVGDQSGLPDRAELHRLLTTDAPDTLR